MASSPCFSRCVPTAVSVLSVLFVAATAFGAGSDHAGNYTASPNTFTNGSNGGTGFAPWAFTLGAGATATLADSTEATGDINSPNGYSFRFYGGNGTWVDAVRNFSTALAPGDTFSFKMAYNWNGGLRGISLLRAGGELMWLNFGGSDELRYDWAGGPGVLLSSTYINTAIVQVVVKQLADYKLDVTLTRCDGWTTNLVSGNLGFPLSGIKFYNGGHAGNNVNYALYANDLQIVESGEPVLTLVGRTAMPANYTNKILVTRNGPTTGSLDVTIESSDENVVVPGGDITIPAGSASAEAEIIGKGRGTAYITAIASGFPDATLNVTVFDIAYDDSSYYEAGTWTNGSNGGAGFEAWAFSSNDGPGTGYTNYAGAFLGSSTGAGGGDVNAQPSGNAFGAYANQSGTGGGPLFEAVRPFRAPLAEGHTLTLDLGVNYRNGAKGVMIQNGGTWLFEVAVINNDYVYHVHGTGGSQTSLGWSYAADTAIRVELTRTGASLYDIQIIRRGALTATNTLTGVDIGGTPDRVRFYIYNTEQGPENNFFFNRLGINSGEAMPVLSVAGQEGMVVNHTNRLIVSRTGSTDASLNVSLLSSDPTVVSVPAGGTIGIGATSASFEVVGESRGQATITVSAPGFSSATADIEVFNVAYDSSAYYGPAAWTNGSNGGVGFGPWTLNNNDGAHDGYTNYAGAFLGDSDLYGGGWVNSASNHAFGLYANQVGDDAGTNGPLSEALRPFTPLAIGQTLTADLGVNYRNGYKGLMIQSAGAWLFKVEVGFDDYWYENVGGGGAYTRIGWTNYAANTAIRVELTRTGEDLYNVTLTRSGTYSETRVLQGIHLGAVPDQVRFYIFDTQPGGENNLYFNRLGINQDQVLTLSGIVNVDIGSTTTLTVTRDGPTADPLTVTLASSDPAVATVPPSVEIAATEVSATFNVTGVTEGVAFIYADATGYVSSPFPVDVFDFPDEWDDAGNYVLASFTNGSNGGAGFGPWQFTALTGGGTIQLRNSRLGSGDINSVNNLSFAFYGGTDTGYVGAARAFNTALAEGDRFAVTLAMNYDGGNRGIDLQDAGGHNLANFNLSGGNNYQVTVIGEGTVNLGWGYNPTSVVRLVAEQLAGNQLKMTLTRNDGLTTNLLSTALTATVGRIFFYNGGHAGDNLAYALFVNDLLITRGGGITDGIPNTWWNKFNVPSANRLAAEDTDGDGVPNGEEYIADTDPMDHTRYFRDRITKISGQALLSLEVGPSTTNSRLYDVWWTTDLLGAQQWTPFLLNVPGPVSAGAFNLIVTNDAPRRFYRTGVKLP